MWFPILTNLYLFQNDSIYEMLEFNILNIVPKIVKII